nr:MAG TPA: ryanodine receptor [Microviridae sp.]
MSRNFNNLKSKTTNKMTLGNIILLFILSITVFA